MNNYPYFGNNQMYMQELQNMRDRLDRQMMQIQQNQQPMQNQQPQGITQNFQLVPNNNTINDFDAKYAKDSDEVKSTLALKNTLFVNKEMSILWLKDAAGNIKSYTLTEIVEIDEKDKQIIALQKQIEELKGVILNDKSNVEYDVANVTNKKSTDVHTNKSNDAVRK